MSEIYEKEDCGNHYGIPQHRIELLSLFIKYSEWILFTILKIKFFDFVFKFFCWDGSS